MKFPQPGRILQAVALAWCALYWGACSHLAYYPSKERLTEPARGDIAYEEVTFRADDGTQLRGWYFPAKTVTGAPPKGVVIQFHGNAENMTTHYLSLFWVTEAGYDFFAFDYRGYGSSEGSPDQRGLNRDARAAIQYIADRSASRGTSRDAAPHLILYGQSLGGAVLARALEEMQEPELRQRIRAVVIEGSFYSYRAIGRDMLARHWITWPFQPLVPLLMSDEFSPEKSFAQISPIPLLVIHGENDQAIPLSFGRKIFELAQDPKDFWVIPRGRHIDTMFRDGGSYREKLIGWIESLPTN